MCDPIQLFIKRSRNSSPEVRIEFCLINHILLGLWGFTRFKPE